LARRKKRKHETHSWPLGIFIKSLRVPMKQGNCISPNIRINEKGFFNDFKFL
jgi:hypothetical protein